MREERDALERLRQSLDADLLRVFGELDEARIRVRSLEAVLANAEEQQDVYILLVGIVILMFGLYRLSRGISSRSETNHMPETRDEEDET